MHANPFDSVHIFIDTRCERALGMHWGTVRLALFLHLELELDLGPRSSGHFRPTFVVSVLSHVTQPFD